MKTPSPSISETENLGNIFQMVPSVLSDQQDPILSSGTLKSETSAWMMLCDLENILFMFSQATGEELSTPPKFSSESIVMHEKEDMSPQVNIQSTAKKATLEFCALNAKLPIMRSTKR